EDDKVSVMAGLRGGYTLGSPLCLQIANIDSENWKSRMDPILEPQGGIVTAPRPGHADYPGAVKYGFQDIRNVIERASARETAMRTAIGAIARQILKTKGIEIYSRVMRLGPIDISLGQIEEEVLQHGKQYAYGIEDNEAESRAETLIEECRSSGTSVGGIVEVVAFNVPVGLGSYAHYERRLDGQIAQALMSIPGVKGVEFGCAFELASSPPGVPGDSLRLNEHQQIVYAGNINGGLAGGVSTGQPLVVKCAIKPIPTAMYGDSVDIATLAPVRGVKERSDVTAVPAVRVIAENVLAWILLVAVLTDGPEANSQLAYPQS
ncbi:MAG: chorismate synthase, partial [Bacillota bacterium]|nr:chorismate synthase [Bacillota bacterium]